MEHRVFRMTTPKVVVGNSRAKMVDMMEPDAAGHPFQEGGKLEIGASLDRGPSVVPLGVVLPIRPLELMLHEEEPQPGNRRDVVRGQVNEKDSCAEETHRGTADEENGEVGGPHTRHLATAGVRATWRNALVQNEVQRPDEQKEDGMADHAVAKLSARRSREILAHGQRADIAVAAP